MSQRFATIYKLTTERIALPYGTDALRFEKAPFNPMRPVTQHVEMRVHEIVVDGERQFIAVDPDAERTLAAVVAPQIDRQWREAERKAEQLAQSNREFSSAALRRMQELRDANKRADDAQAYIGRVVTMPMWRRVWWAMTSAKKWGAA